MTRPNVAIGVAARTNIVYNETTLHDHGGANLVCEAGENNTQGCPVNVEDNPPMCPAGTSRGNPVDAGTGLKIEKVVDFESAGPNPLRLERTFVNNGNPRLPHMRTSLTGSAWRMNFDGLMVDTGNSSSGMIVSLPDGRDFHFRSGGVPYSVTNGAFVQAKGRSVTRLVADTEQIYTTENGIRYVFDTAGKDIFRFVPLSRIEFPGGYKQFITSIEYGTKNYRVTRVDDSYGRSLVFEYEEHPPEAAAGLLTFANRAIRSVKFNDQEVVRYTYESALNETRYDGALGPLPPGLANAVVRLKRVDYPQATGEKIEYHYEDTRYRDALTGKTDGRNIRVSTVTYDTNRRVASSKRANGLFEYQFAYDFTAGTRTVTNPLGKQEVMTINVAPGGKQAMASSQGVASANCVASNTTHEWDTNFFLAKETDAEGRITTFANDTVTGLPTQIVRGFGTTAATTTNVTWNSTWRVPAQVVEPGLTTSLVWDASGKLTGVTQTDTTSHTVPFSTNGRTRTWIYGYDTSGRLTSVDGPLAGTGDVVSYTYNPQGFVQTITNEVGHVTTVTAWNFRGQPASVTDANGVVTTYTYDGMGRVTSVVVNPGAEERRWGLTYTLAGDLATFAEPMGATYSLTWDDARRLMAVQNNIGERIEYTRDAMGNITQRSVKDEQGNVAFVENNFVDELGRLIKLSTYEPKSWRFAYDRTDRLASVTDPRTKLVSYGYDAVGRAIRETERDTGVVNLSYNGKDEITSYKDPRNLTTSYVRNGFGDVIQETSPDRGVTKYDHDARGLMTTMTDGRNVVTNFTYDAAGRMLTRTHPSAAALNVTYTYDSVANGNFGRGRLTSVQDAAGTVTYRYDAQGQVTQEVRTIGGVALTTSFNFSGAGHLWSITYPSGRQARYGYDALGRKNYVDVKRSASVAENVILDWVGYLPFGGPRGFTLSNGLFRWDSYDAEYRLEGMQITRNDTGLPFWENWPWWGNDGMNLMTLSDGLDATKTQTFTYDNVGRLASGTGAYGTRGYTYDKVGNRLTEVRTPAGGSAVTQTYAYVANTNRLANVKQGTTTLRAFVYDAAGNMTRDTRGSTQYNYTISAAGRISEVKVGTQLRATYLYDHKNRLKSSVRQNVSNAGTTRYIHDHADRIIAELDAAGNTLREYIWLDDMPVAVLDGTVNQANPSLFWVHADHLNRPLMMTDATKAVVWRAFYEPFGAVHSIAGPAVNDNRFPGQWFQRKPSDA